MRCLKDVYPPKEGWLAASTRSQRFFKVLKLILFQDSTLDLFKPCQGLLLDTCFINAGERPIQIGNRVIVESLANPGLGADQPG